MTIQPNSRQVPKQHNLIIEKYYSDVLYSHLQVISQKTNTNIRYITKKDANFSQLGIALNLSRQTVSKRFNKLIELGLIIPDEEKNIFILTKLNAEAAFLIPQDTLRQMVSTLNENTINTYVYLANRFIANGEKPFDFTIVSVKEFCGLGTKSSSNNYIVTDILHILSLLGLIKYSLIDIVENNNIKTYYKLESVSNVVKNLGGDC